MSHCGKESTQATSDTLGFANSILCSAFIHNWFFENKVTSGDKAGLCEGPFFNDWNDWLIGDEM